MVGLVSFLIKNPGSFLVSILVAVGIGFVIFMIFNAILNRRGPGNSDEMKKYKKAVKQSKLKYGNQKPKGRTPTRASSRTASPSRPKRRKRHVTHLTVIDGKKTTGKNNDDRASN